MTNKMLNTKKFFSLLIAFALVAVTPIGLLQNKTSAASGDSIYLVPSTTSVQNGNEFTVDVRANAFNFSSVQSYLSFPSSIQYVSYSVEGSSLPNSFAPTGNQCPVSLCIVNYTNPPGSVSGDVFMVKVKFRAAAGSGNAQISLSNDSIIASASDGSIIQTAKGSATITLTSPPAPPAPPAQTTTPADTSTNTNNTENKTTPSSPNNAVVKPSPPVAVQASPQNPLPAISKAEAKNDPLLAPQDVKATITIKDLSGKLVRNTTVKINDKEYKTDKNGKVVFEGKAYGVLTVTYNKDGKQVPLGKVTLVKGATDDKYEIIASENIASPAGSSLPILPGIVSVLLIAVGFFSVMRINKIRQDRKNMALHGLGGSVTTNPSPSTQQPMQPIQPIISSDNVTTTNPSATIITPTQSEALSNEDIAEAAKNIVEDKKI